MSTALKSKPQIFHVERSTIIEAPAETIHPFLNDFRNYASWIPYEQGDASLKRAFSGSSSGVGAIYDWAGRGKAGVGRMEILESSPSEVVIDLKLTKPLNCTNLVRFSLEPVSGGTKVTWAMDAEHTFISKVAGFFLSMDRIVGKDFEVGLANLKALAAH